jgi:glutamate synthase (NADPH/NADH) small chain
VIGAGNTAIDAAIQSKRLGAETVTLVYRRGEESMSATNWEVDLARLNDVNVLFWCAPKSICEIDGKASMIFQRTKMEDNKLVTTAEEINLETDMVLTAIGQKLDPSCLPAIDSKAGKVTIDENYQTSMKGVFAGGDCIASGEDLTVQAVEDGKQAAFAIDRYLLKSAEVKGVI